MTALQPNCVRHSGAPAYPTKLQVEAMPELLAQHQPPAWRNRELAGAAGLLMAASVAGCSSSGDSGAPAKVSGARLAPYAPVIVAPIFHHGEGIASAGCVVVAVPVFLSEEAALQVIADELANYGIDLSQRYVNLPGTGVKTGELNYGYDWIAGKHTARFVTKIGPLNVDGLDARRNIAVEFVSEKDYEELLGPWFERRMGTAYFVETRAVAKGLSEQVRGQPAGVFFGAFYDPYYMSDIELDYESLDNYSKEQRSRPDYVNHDYQNDPVYAQWNQAWNKAKKLNEREAKDALRAQVKDFVDWLKAQGAI